MAEESGAAMECLYADGGASRNDLLMQFQADILGWPVARNLSSDLSALGAAYLAGQVIKLWSSEAEIQALDRSQERFEPKRSRLEREELYAGWKHAIRQVTTR
jgi:glycerol kinase